MTMTLTMRNSSLFIILTTGFALFYTVQVPLSTSSADVVAFGLRSQASRPMLTHAYLDGRTLLEGKPLANYHLAHTVALWLAYRCAPEKLSSTVAPAGFFSALCGGLVVGLSYLIWVRLGLRRKEAVAAACVAGLIPSVWYHSLIGEVYIPQLAGVLLFVVLFLYARPFLAGLALLCATLVSPLAVLCFPLALLAGWEKSVMRKMIVVGTVALVGYVGIHWVIGLSPLGFLHGVTQDAVGKPLPYKLLSLAGILLLNLHVLLVALVKGSRTCTHRLRGPSKALLLVVGFHALLPVVSADFLVDKGCFLLPLFWAASMPIGVVLVNPSTRWWQVLGLAVVSVAVMQAVWLFPSRYAAKTKEEAGLFLRGRFGQEIKVMGDWGTALPIAAALAGWDYERVVTHYYDVAWPGPKSFLASGEDSLLLAIGRKTTLRRLAARIPLPGFRVEDYVPDVPGEMGKLEEILTGENFAVYLWTAPR